MLGIYHYASRVNPAVLTKHKQCVGKAAGSTRSKPQPNNSGKGLLFPLKIKTYYNSLI